MDLQIPKTPRNEAAIGLLKELAKTAPYTLYVEDKEGHIIPVMNVTKHPDCPDGLYEEIIKRLNGNKL